jgi:hypothetical protein
VEPAPLRYQGKGSYSFKKWQHQKEKKPTKVKDLKGKKNISRIDRKVTSRMRSETRRGILKIKAQK